MQDVWGKLMVIRSLCESVSQKVLVGSGAGSGVGSVGSGVGSDRSAVQTGTT